MIRDKTTEDRDGCGIFGLIRDLVHSFWQHGSYREQIGAIPGAQLLCVACSKTTQLCWALRGSCFLKLDIFSLELLKGPSPVRSAMPVSSIISTANLGHNPFIARPLSNSLVTPGQSLHGVCRGCVSLYLQSEGVKEAHLGKGTFQKISLDLQRPPSGACSAIYPQLHM